MRAVMRRSVQAGGRGCGRGRGGEVVVAAPRPGEREEHIIKGGPPREPPRSTGTILAVSRMRRAVIKSGPTGAQTGW